MTAPLTHPSTPALSPLDALRAPWRRVRVGLRRRDLRGWTPEELRELAVAPDLDGLLQAALVGAEDEGVLAAVLGRGDLAVEAQETAAADRRARVRRLLARNPALSPAMVERLADDPDAVVVEGAWAHPRMPARRLAEARTAAEVPVAVRAGLAGRADADPAWLARMARGGDVTVVCAALANPRLPVAEQGRALRAIAARPSWKGELGRVHSAVAANPATDEATLLLLVPDGGRMSDPAVLEQVAVHPRATRAVLRRLLDTGAGGDAHWERALERWTDFAGGADARELAEVLGLAARSAPRRALDLLGRLPGNALRQVPRRMVAPLLDSDSAEIREGAERLVSRLGDDPPEGGGVRRGRRGGSGGEG